MTASTHSVCVVGSTNMDLIMQVNKLPAPGETVGEGRFSTALGGKGANQAVAAARSGAHTVFVSVVGGDDFGRLAKRRFDTEGICIEHLTTSSEPTGTALIFVDEQGENCIGVAPGANVDCTEEQVSSVDALEQAKVVLLQLEIPYATVRHTLTRATRARRLLNAAPARLIPPEDLALVNTLIVNQTELYQVLGESARPQATQEELRQACARLRQSGVEDVVVTLGSDGVYVYNASVDERVAGFTIDVADTTGAGDTFCGALAAQLAADKEMLDAVRFAQASAALACTGLGAQSAMPTAGMVDAFLTLSMSG